MESHIGLEEEAIVRTLVWGVVMASRRVLVVAMVKTEAMAKMEAMAMAKTEAMVMVKTGAEEKSLVELRQYPRNAETEGV